MFEKIAVAFAAVAVFVLTTMSPVQKQVVDLRYQWIQQPVDAPTMQVFQYVNVAFDRLPAASKPQQRQLPVVLARAPLEGGW